jgi:glycine/serine hydroxymethyltransferase
MKEKEMKQIAAWLDAAINEVRPYAYLPFSDFETKVKKSVVIKAIAKQIKALCAKFPLDF